MKIRYEGVISNYSKTVTLNTNTLEITIDEYGISVPLALFMVILEDRGYKITAPESEDRDECR